MEPDEAPASHGGIPDEEMRRKLLFYDSFFRDSEDMLYALDLENRVIHANEALLKVWGLSWPEAKDKTLLELGYEKWLADYLNEQAGRAARTRHAVRGEVPYRGTPGLRQYEYQLSPILGPHGEVVAISGVARDVTERKEAEKHASVVNELSRRLVNLVSEEDIIRAAVNAVGGFLQCARCYFAECFEDEGRAEIGLNWTRPGVPSIQGSCRLADFGGPDWWDRFAMGDLAIEDVRTHPLTRNHAEGYEKMGVRSYMVQPFHREGQRLVVLAATGSIPRRWSAADLRLIENVVARVWPLVEQARDTEVRLRLLEDLRQIDQRKDRFLATLAHELRNPLAPVLTGVEIIEKSPGDPRLIGQVSGMVRRQIRQMVDLIDDLLEISRIKTGKIVLKKSVHPLSRLLRNAVETTDPAISQGAHTLDVQLPPDDIHVDVDPSRVAQIAANLLSNAARYTPEGGHIRLHAGTDGNDAWIRVTDNGAGIESEEQASVFELFHQTKLGSSQGMGIGLTLVKNLVELHGGTVTVFSEGKDRGSEFTVRLPCCVVDGQPASVPAAPRADGAAFKKVLVVDDGKNAADILKMFFEMEGLEVEVAYDGLSGLEKAKAFAPDLVVMDLGMPKMDGFEAARLMNEWDSSIRLVALSGWSREEDRRRSAEAGFGYHLVKPVTPDDLRRMLVTVA